MVYLSISVYTEPERSNVDAEVLSAANDSRLVVKPITPEVKLDDTELKSPAFPHIITLPSLFSAANANGVE